MEFVISTKGKFDTFANVFQHLKEFNDSFNFMFSATGLYIQGFDKCHVSIFELNLNAKWFDTYAYTSQQNNIQVGFNAKTFHKILTTHQDNQNMMMTIDSDMDNYVITFIGGGKKEYDKNFKIPLLDVDCEIFSIPQQEEDVEFTILQSCFASVIDQLIIFGETVNIKIDNDNVMFRAEGLEGEMEAKISTDDLEEFSADECDNDDTLINQDYSLKLLKNLCLFSKIGNFIKVSVSNARPVCISYDIEMKSDTDLDNMMDNMTLSDEDTPTYLRLYLAPKI
jgi:proliferating cell nuclear antigen PCNA